MIWAENFPETTSVLIVELICLIKFADLTSQMLKFKFRNIFDHCIFKPQAVACLIFFHVDVCVYARACACVCMYPPQAMKNYLRDLKHE